MIYRLYFLIFTLGISCTTKTTENKIEYPFYLVSSKDEVIGGNKNRMDLFVPTEQLDIAKLKSLCLEKKRLWENGTFYYLVVFDKEKNAAFPTTPFTALYGLDEMSQRNILAVFEYNRLNGFGQLTTYSPNMWEGKPTVYKLK